MLINFVDATNDANHYTKPPANLEGNGDKVPQWPASGVQGQSSGRRSGDEVQDKPQSPPGAEEFLLNLLLKLHFPE